MFQILTFNNRNLPTLGGLVVIFLTFYYGVFYKSAGSGSPIISNVVRTNESCISLGEMVTTLRQDDPRILDYIRKHHLTPPSTLPYNLDDPEADKFDGMGISEEIERILKKKKNGFFIEAGSHKGERQSSTLGFEKYYNWTGLCVEPSPLNLPIWKRKNRKAWLADVCLSTSRMPMVVDFFHNYKDTMGSQIGAKEVVMKKPGEWVNFKVPCFPIFSLLKAMGVDAVDYFNLDVEGVEFEVIKTIPFQEILIRTISIELHVPDEKGREDLARLIKEYLTAQGYSVEFERLPDLVFAHWSLV